MLIKNDKDFAEHLGTHPDNLKNYKLEYVDYRTTVESDGYSVIVRLCEDDLPSHNWVLAYPFDSDYFDNDVLSSVQCYADYLAHEGKGKHGNYEGIYISEDLPPLLEDEIAEILDNHTGEEICIMRNPSNATSYTYNNYESDNKVVFAIYEALRRHYFVTVGNKNIIDL